ncbi:MAG: type I DNA topoisomerase [Oscillatoria sp. SIO1A7]|nr:type I DNA topoisomerase [Oscillatoria sp. SIO1A7]
MSTLVIVESPTKARTIRNYLPAGYRVEASMGHIRDLPQSASEIPEKVKSEPWAGLGVNVEGDFEPLYVIPKDKKKVVKTLKEALEDAEEVILATDEDREGESISWHLLAVLKPKVPFKRMVFHEITSEAIQKALQNCRDIDEQLVRAQETRRILDRLFGYTLSPLLWKKIASGLSAGRVQSVAVRLLVQRERDRRAFVKASYSDLKATLSASAPKTGTESPSLNPDTFEAKLVALNGSRLATGNDFDQGGNLIATRSCIVLGQEEAIALQEQLTGSVWTVSKIEERPTKRKPAPPFTTSTLQQESNRKLGLSARDTMRVAQSLYENGFITYMRTDSVHLSEQAITAARSCVEELYGREYLSPQPRQYSTKSKNAQEAHEAIRPAGSKFRKPEETGLANVDLRLYDLIWKRTVACQMADARQTFVTLELQVSEAVFRASGKRIDFPGFLRAYVEGSDDPNAALENQEVILPSLAVGDNPECNNLEALYHETQPPARYTEASLVKTLESEGIGRPSTYASVIGTIVDRGYAQHKGNALAPTFTAFAVNNLLEKHFPDLVDTTFTARMEQTLDEISLGSADWLPYLREFYKGDKGLDTQVKQQETEIDPQSARTIELENLDAKIRIGRYGPYVEAENGSETVTASIPKDLTPADVSSEEIEIFLKQKTAGPEKIGDHPETEEPIYLCVGQYGPYVQLGDASEEKKKKPKRASLPKGITTDSINLETAVGLLSLPRLLGTHPETECKVKAGLGRFGPYVVHDRGKEGKDYRSLKAEDDILTISLERALELLAQPKRSRGKGGTSSRKPLRELGKHPDNEEAVNIYDGRYGPYIKHGKTNVSLPEGKSVEELTLAEALDLLAAKAATSKGSRKSTKSGSSSSKKKTKSSSKTTKNKKKEANSDSDNPAASTGELEASQEKSMTS